jgi:hypothetical protein
MEAVFSFETLPQAYSQNITQHNNPEDLHACDLKVSSFLNECFLFFEHLSAQKYQDPSAMLVLLTE